MNFGDPSGLDSILVTDTTYFDGQLYCIQTRGPEGERGQYCMLAGLMVNRNSKRQYEERETPRQLCDDPITKMVVNFVQTRRKATEAIQNDTGLYADFVLAWAGGETDYGRSDQAEINNNYLNLKIPKINPWPGQIESPAEAVLGFASFGGTTLYESVLAALTGQDGRYPTPALEAQAAGGSIAEIAQAIKDAGFTKDAGYDRLVAGAHDAIVRRKHCID